MSKPRWRFVGRKVSAAGHRAGQFTLLRLRHKHGLDHLPLRQSEVALLFAQGLSHKEIAHQLTIHPTTVRNHLALAYRTLAVTSRAELRALAAAG